MTCGTAVIAYRVGSVPEGVDGITGFIVDNEGQAIRAVNERTGSTEQCSAPGARSASCEPDGEGVRTPISRAARSGRREGLEKGAATSRQPSERLR
ncbi:hypothetical protein [Bradyrhizobium australafricanum]|uniref:hypothetical protein n=1 Tax=Bradyrhizobium australafricanum TaxID=2821406 RepID=UPI00201BB029|nr:hypothetical protein [Bradyrhizobium australafricanum]